MTVDGTPVRDLIPLENWNNTDVTKHLILNPLLVAVQISKIFNCGYYDLFGLYDPQYDLWYDMEFVQLSLLAGVRPHLFHCHLASARQHPDAKTTLQAGEQGFQRETCAILQSLDLGGDMALEAAPAKALSTFLRLTSWRVIEMGVVCEDRWKLVKRAIAELACSPSLILCRPFWGLDCRGLMPEWIGLRIL